MRKRRGGDMNREVFLHHISGSQDPATHITAIFKLHGSQIRWGSEDS